MSSRSSFSKKASDTVTTVLKLEQIREDFKKLQNGKEDYLVDDYQNTLSNMLHIKESYNKIVKLL